MEKEILREMKNRKNKGLFSPSNLFNGIGKGKKDKEIHELISEGYIEEVPRDRVLSNPGGNNIVRNITFYKITSNGRKFISPAYKRIFYFMKDKIKFLIKTIVTASVFAVITWMVTNYLNKK